MTSVRAGQHQGVSQEMTLDQQVLQELRDVNDQLAVLKVELLGRDGEPQHGRLPRVEASLEDHETRIKRLEKAYFIAGVVVGAMGTKILAPLLPLLIEVMKR